VFAILSRWGFPITGLLVIAAAVAIPFGCARPPGNAPARVDGTVYWQGRPLVDGLVSFSPDPERGGTGKLMVAAIGSDGGFRLAEGQATIFPGWYRVAISDGVGSSESAGFPVALRRPDRSGLEREVKPGQDHHFEFLIEPTR